MPPTFKDSSTLPHSPENAARGSEAPANGAEVSSAQPVALEVPVTVNGARAVEGSEKREPFSETTSTVLVLVNGAVIRLSASVAPGQLLFLTNEKTRKEVVCQVVKSKNYRSASGYVELEFTEPVLGFWGMRFPGDRSTAVASLAATRKSDPVAAAEPPKSIEAKEASYVDARQPTGELTSNLADAVEEFKTEIKTDPRPARKADLLAPTETSNDGLKLEANRLQEQLSALLFAEQGQGEAKPSASGASPSKPEPGDAAAKILEMADDKSVATKLPASAAKADLSSAHPAPKETQPAATSSFESEEVKIPAWLEPLARNASVPAPLEEEGGIDSTSDDWHAAEAPGSVPSQKPSAAATAKKPISTPKQKSTAAVFGNSLLGDTTPEMSKPRGSGKGLGLAIAAGLILAAASGGWYFRESLGLPGAASKLSQSNSLTSAASASPAVVAPVKSAQTSAVATEPSSGNVPIETPVPVSSPTQGKVQAAAITERIPKANSGIDVIKAPEKSIEVVEPEAKRPSLGNVRLAKPKIGRSANVQANSTIEPTLELDSDSVPAGANSLATNLGESTNQPAAPAAPITVGGDVKQARMISSVPPTYPALAKTQHVEGAVRVDALVDANGRITTMKVVSGPSLLHQAAMDALRQWRYQPATLDGKAVAMHLTVTIQFRLQ
jgi:periplasmic protein TonB